MVSNSSGVSSSPIEEEQSESPKDHDDDGLPILVDIIWRRLSVFCLIYAICWTLILVYYTLVVPSLGFGYPWSTFLFDPRKRFADLTDSWRQAKAANPYSTPGSYFPLTYLVLRGARYWSVITVKLVYCGLSLGGVLAVLLGWLHRQRAFWRGDSRWLAVITLTLFVAICNYPLMLALDRGNLDPIAMCLMYWAVVCVRNGYSSSGSLLLALASSTKGFPFATVTLWVRRRRFSGILMATAGLAATVLMPATVFAGGVSLTLARWGEHMRSFRLSHVEGIGSAHFSADFLNAIRVFGDWFLGGGPAMHRFVDRYQVVTLVVATIVSALAVFVIREVWRELLAVVFVMLTFPNVTNDYKLVFLLPVVLEWLVSTTTGWRNWVFGSACLLLFIPKHFYYHGKTPDVDSSISCLISPFLVLTLGATLWPNSAEIARLRQRIGDVLLGVEKVINRSE